MNTLKIRIGEMAKIHGISAQTLRFYDKMDLFKPSYTDGNSGYRYYGIEQFAHLESILYLKSMGMPLKEIKTYFNNRDLNSMLSLLKERISSIENQIQLFISKKKKIESTLTLISNYIGRDIMEMCRVQDIPRRSMLFFSFGNGGLYEEHEMGIKKLEMALDNIDELYMNPFASVIGKEEIEKGEYSNFKGISIVFSDKNRCNLTTNSLPESTYATMAFVGTYKNIDTHFQHLIKWISDNHYEVTGDGLVLIITDKAYSDFEYEYISEIQIPVKKFLKTS